MFMRTYLALAMAHGETSVCRAVILRLSAAPGNNRVAVVVRRPQCAVEMNTALCGAPCLNCFLAVSVCLSVLFCCPHEYC